MCTEILSKTKSLYGKSSHVICLNTFTLHFPKVNIIQSTQSSLKWNLIWNERRGWLWIHSLFISRSKTFTRVSNLLWNEKLVIFELFEGVVGFEYIHSSFPDRKRSPVYPILFEMKSSLKLVFVFELFEGMVGFEYIHSSFPDRKHSPEYPIFSKMKSYLKWSLLWNSWSSLNLFLSLNSWSSSNCSTSLQLSGSTWIFFVFKLFEGVVVFELVFDFELFQGVVVTCRIDLNFLISKLGLAGPKTLYTHRPLVKSWPKGPRHRYIILIDEREKSFSGVF